MEEKLQYKPSQTLKIRNQLLQELEKYQSYVGYDYLKKILKGVAMSTLIKIEGNNFQNIEKYIKEMHQEISLVFQRYHAKRLQIGEMSPEVYWTRNKQIIRAYETLNRNFRQGLDMYEVNQEIENIKNQIEGHYAQKRR